ncbi:glycosyltransferase [Lederbergia panacisoli]|uniref:glycosyltransferase n=1 Tax=Lederbergia panacisoli TaxID=1255251 RepID=UPI00214BDE14|nr:glycosyltransferase [Lederbergia panacisoli]MCR2823818.1 glycosyltransferase [Lederbergia panacisoli]
MAKKKIGLLVPDLQSGGAERVISIISNLLSNEYEVYFFLFDSNKISYKYSGTLIDLNSKAKGNILIKILNRIIRIVKLSYYKRKLKLDTVISFLHAANVVNADSNGRAKKVLSCRGYRDFVKNSNRYYKLLKKSDLMLVQTQRMKNEFLKKFEINEDKIQVLENPYESDTIKKLSLQAIEDDVQKFIDKHRTICSVGTFKKDKGFWHLVQAFCKLKKTLPDAGLIIIGHRGEMEEQIKQMVTESSYSEDVLFLGYQENPFKYISKCDLYVSSSLHEGFPNSLVEAMLCGAPVLSTDCKVGPAEILGKENIEQEIWEINFEKYGVLVPALEEEVSYSINRISEKGKLLVEAMTVLLSNEGMRKNYKKVGRERACEFDVKHFYNKINRII